MSKRFCENCNKDSDEVQVFDSNLFNETVNVHLLLQGLEEVALNIKKSRE